MEKTHERSVPIGMHAHGQIESNAFDTTSFFISVLASSTWTGQDRTGRGGAGRAPERNSRGQYLTTAAVSWRATQTHKTLIKLGSASTLQW